MSTKSHIPNVITLLNLTMGIFSIYYSFQGSQEYLAIAGYLIFIAALFDFFDGFTARLLNAKSEIGLQLDSLADMVSFGVAPGFILYQMIILSHGKPMDVINGFNLFPLWALLIPWGAALRLAKFNTDESQQTGFKGMPTPAMAFLIASLPIIRVTLYTNQGMIYMIFTNSYFLAATAISGFFLMTCRFPMFALKFTNYKWKGNEFRFTFLFISLIILILFQAIAIPFIIALYLFLSLIIYLSNMQYD
jgi:CDP-diacylglycerol--serine O-phosphatidyltransferase